MFGPNQPVSLRLLDVPEAIDTLRACELELRDCARLLLTDVSSSTDPMRACDGADCERSALEVINDPHWVENVLGPTIAGRNDELFRPHGTMPAGSIAQAILGTGRSIVTPTPYERWFRAGVVSDGSDEVPRGLVFGFPLITADGKDWSVVPNHYLDEASRQRIAPGMAEIQHESTAVNDLLGTI